MCSEPKARIHMNETTPHLCLFQVWSRRVAVRRQFLRVSGMVWLLLPSNHR